MTYDAPLNVDSVLGDSWVARIKAEHERLGDKCPCGNHPEQETTMNTEARALADALDADYVGAHLQARRDMAMEALYGGRALVSALGRKLSTLRSAVESGEQERVDNVWRYNIDPAYSSWLDVAYQAKKDEASRYSFVPDSKLRWAEAMLDWPIYRAAILAQQRDVIDASGHSTMRGLSSATLDVLDQLGSSEPVR